MRFGDSQILHCVNGLPTFLISPSAFINLVRVRLNAGPYPEDQTDGFSMSVETEHASPPAGRLPVGVVRNVRPDRLQGRALAIIFVLMAANILNFVDRQLPFILVEAIKADLQLSDAQIGIIMGPAYAIAYALAILPLAYVADRISARGVLASSLAIWSCFTAVTAFIMGFTGLLAARVGVAASEAGSTPASHAIIARYYPEDRRAFTLALFSVGAPIGAMMGLMLGGWINDILSWRAAFLLVGLPGVGLAIVAWRVLPDIKPDANQKRSSPSFLWGVRRMFGIASFRHMVAASAVFSCGSYGMNVFASAFLMRSYGFSTAEAGLAFGFAFGVGGIIGTFAGGTLCDRLGKRSPKWRQIVPGIGQLLLFPTMLGAWLAPTAVLSVGCLTLSYVFGLLYFAPTFAVAQSLAPDQLRASTSAMMALCITLIGSSVGPLVVGMVSDHLQPQLGGEALRYALCAITFTALWAAMHFFAAARCLPDDLNAHVAVD